VPFVHSVPFVALFVATLFFWLASVATGGHCGEALVDLFR